MAKKKQTRRSLAETWDMLNRDGWELPRDRRRRPRLIDHHGGWERKGDPTTIEFFRVGFEGADLSNLTLPRRYINRSDFQQVSFRNTDLNQSFMCWNDFIGCDFTDADLTCCDMRASVFEDCKFVRCKLAGADMRRSSFEGSDFTGADLTGALLDVDVDIEVSDKQRFTMDVTLDEGPQPKGG
jgi:uncharacterized protein YjbI with pentapeptide repeats